MMRVTKSFPQFLCGFLVLTFAATAPGQGSGQAPATPLPWTGEESVDVELRTVPFYAVDGDGRPVYDLAAHEVELVVDGRRITPDTFDTYALAPETGTAGPDGVEAEVGAAGAVPAARGDAYAPRASRQVFFLFDQSFSSPAGLHNSQLVADALIQRLPASDQLYLVTNHPQTGFRQELGPLPANAEGKQLLRERIAALLPAVARLQVEAEGRLPPLVLGSTRNGVPAEQAHNAYETIGALGRSEYRSAAEQLADSYGVFASHLQQIHGPKLVLNFSNGIDRRLFFEGEVGFAGVGSTEAYKVDTRRAGPMVQRFHAPLTALAESGATLVFVNTKAENTTGRDSLHTMSDTAGGVVLEGVNVEILEERIARATSAYYEAGFYTREGLADSDPTAVEVVVRRPGVTVISPRRLQSRLLYASLSAREKEYFVVDLVHRGVEGLEAGSDPRASLHPLAGRVLGRSPGDEGRLLFEAVWPQELAGEQLDLYEVVLEVRHGSEEVKLVRFENRAVAAGKPLRLATPLPRAGEVAGDSAYIWGIVAVEPRTGETYIRRLMLQSPLRTAAAGPPTSGR